MGQQRVISLWPICGARQIGNAAQGQHALWEWRGPCQQGRGGEGKGACPTVPVVPANMHLFDVAFHSTSNSPAAPMPPPTHMVTTT